MASTAPSFAATKTFNVASGNYNVAGNWSPSGIPAAGDDVIIPAGTVCTSTDLRTCLTVTLRGTLNVNANLTVTSASAMTIDTAGAVIGGTARLITSNAASLLAFSNGTLTATGTPTLEFSSLSETGACTLDISSGALLKLQATSGTPFPDSFDTLALTGGTVEHEATFTANVTVQTRYQSGAAQIVYGNLTIDNGAAATIKAITGNPLRVDGLLLINDGVFAPGAAMDLNDVTIETGEGETLEAGGFTHTVSGNWSRSGVFTAGTSTIDFDGTGTVNATTFNNVIISAGTRTVSANTVTVGGTLEMKGGATWSLAALDPVVTGAASVTGNFTITGAAGSLPVFNGGVTVSGGDLALSTAVSLTVNGSPTQIDATRTLTVGSGTTFTGSTTISLSGALSVAGTMNASNAGTSVAFSGGTLSTSGAAVLTIAGTMTESGVSTLDLYDGATAASLKLTGTSGTPMPSTFDTVDFANATVEYEGTFVSDVTVQTDYAGGVIAYYNLTIDNGAAATIKAITGNPLRVDGLLLINDGVFAPGAAMDLTDVTIETGEGETLEAGGFTHTVSGNWSRSGVFTAGASTIDFDGSAATTTTGLMTTTNSFYNLRMNKTGAGSVALGANIDVTGAAQFTGGTLDLGIRVVNVTGLSTFDGSATIAGTTGILNFNGGWAFTSGALYTSGTPTLNVAGTSTESGTSVLDLYDGTSGATLKFTSTSGTPMPATFDTVDFGANSTVEYEALITAAVTVQTQYAGGTISYDTLIIDNGAAAGLKMDTPAATTLKVDGQLTINDGEFAPAGNGDFATVQIDNVAGNVFEGGANIFTVSGNWVNNRGATGYLPGTGRVEFDGTGAVTASGATTWYDLTINKSGGGQVTSTAVWTIGRHLALTLGTWDQGTANQTHTVGGDWTATGGAFTPDAGTVTFNGSGTQTLTATASTPFFNLTIDGASNAAQSATNITVGGALIANDTLDFTASNSLAVTGMTTVASGVTVTFAGTNTVTFTNDLNLDGTVIFNGAATVSAGDRVASTGGTMTFNAGGSLAVTTFYDMETLAGQQLNVNAATVTLGTYLRGRIAGQQVNISTGSLTCAYFGVAGSWNSYFDVNITSTGSFTTTGTTNQQLYGAVLVSGAGSFNATGSGTYYTGIYGSCTLANSGAVMDINGRLHVAGTATLSCAGFAPKIYVAEDFTAGTNGYGAFTPGNSEVILDGSLAALTYPSAFYDLTITKSAAVTVTQSSTVTPIVVQNTFTVQGAGTYTANSKAHDFHHVTQSAGAFTATAVTHTVSGNWAMSGGAFTNTGSTVQFDGAGSISSTGAFNTVAVAAGGGTHTLTGSGTVDGAFTVSSGTLAVNAALTLTLNGAASIAGGALTSAGNLAVNADWTDSAGTVSCGGGEIRLGGSSNTAFSSTSGSLFNDFVLDMNAPATSVAYSGAASIGGNVTLTRGTFDMQSLSRLTLTDASVFTVTATNAKLKALGANSASWIIIESDLATPADGFTFDVYGAFEARFLRVLNPDSDGLRIRPGADVTDFNFLSFDYPSNGGCCLNLTGVAALPTENQGSRFDGNGSPTGTVSNVRADSSTQSVDFRDFGGSLAYNVVVAEDKDDDALDRIRWRDASFPLIDGTLDDVSITQHRALTFDLSGFEYDAQDGGGRRYLAVGDDAGRIFAVDVKGVDDFGAPVLLTDTNSYARGVGIGDFDGDGRFDVVFGVGNGKAYFIRRVTVSEPDLLASDFAAPLEVGTFTANSYGMDLAVEDFDNDGDLDFVISGNNGYYTLFLGNGDGTFVTRLLYSDGPSAGRAKAAADFDRDGRLDFASLESGNTDLTIWKGYGDGDFRYHTLSAAAPTSNGYGMAAGDFDGDRIADLVTHNNSTRVFYFHKGLGNGDFAAKAGMGANTTTAGTIGFDGFDLNFDGKLDVVVTEGSTKNLCYFPGNGDGTLGAIRNIPNPAVWSASYGIAAPTYGSPRLNWNIDQTSVNTTLLDAQITNGAADLMTLSPKLGQTGSDDLTLILSDANGFVSLKADVTVTVNAQSTAAPPINARLDAIAVKFNQPRNLDLSAYGSDPDDWWGKSFLVSGNDSANLYVMTINGDGSFGAPVSLGDRGDYIRGAAVADFDNDGDLDIVFARGNGTYDLFMIRRLSGGALDATDFSSNIRIGDFTDSDWGMDLACEDFDGDGSMDVVVSGNNGYYSLWLNDGEGRFTKNEFETAGPSAGRAKAPGDFNGDGKLDFISTESDTLHLYVWQGDGQGGFARTQLTNLLPAANAYGLAAADFDGDAKVDAVVNDAGGALYFLKGTGNGTFEAPLLLANPTGFSGNLALDAGDYNGDGKWDLLICDNNGDDLVYAPGQGDGTFLAQVAVALNYTTGTNLMVATPTFGSKVLTWSVDPASVNGALLSSVTITDADADVLTIVPVNGQTGSDDVTLILTDHNLGVTQKTDVTITVSGFVGDNPVIEGTADNFTTTDDRALVIDLSNFGWDPDAGNGLSYVVVGDDSTRLYVMPYYGDGSFGALVNLGDQQNSIRGAGIADFDNDGDLDLVFAAGNGTAYFIERVAKSDPMVAADFTTKVSVGTFSANSWGMDLAVGDFDNDGKQDFLLSGNNGVYTMFRGNGDGSFAVSTIDAAGPSAGRAKDAADFDEDGMTDFVSLESDTMHLYFWKGDGALGFTRTQYANVLPANGNYGLAAGDFNHDGHADVVTHNSTTGALLFLAGNGQGAFAGAVSAGQTLAATGAAAFDAVDMDGDGKLDLIVTLAGGLTGFSRYPGNGDGTFGAPTFFSATFSGTALLAACPDYGSTTLTWSVDAPSVNTTLFSASVTNATADLLTITPVASAFGQDDITIVLTDSNSGVTQKTDVSVIILNAGAAAPPVIQNELDAIQVREDFVRQVDLSAYGYDPDNANGRPYIAYADEAGILWVLESTGAGIFGTPVSLGDFGSNINGCGIADVDHDGDLDILFGRSDGNVSLIRRASVSVPMAASDFSPSVLVGAFTAGSYGMDLAVEDFNHDGHADFVISGNNGNYRLFLGDGLGGFTVSTLDSSGPANGRGKDAADFDNDGHPDFVALDSATSNLYLWKGDGAGNFQRLEIIAGLPDASNRYGCAAADFDGDGNADLIVNNASGGVYFIKGLGTLGFQAPALLFSIAGETVNIALDALDWDNDGLPDLIASADVANDILYYRNTTSGAVSFAAGVIIHADWTAATNRGVACPNFGSKKLSWSLDSASVNTALFSASISNATTDRLTITPVAGQTGSDDITLILTDGNGGSAQKSDVTVTINGDADGDPLIFGAFDGFSFPQNIGGLIDASTFGYDRDGGVGKPFFVALDDDTNVYVVQMNGDGSFAAPVTLGNLGGSDNIRAVTVGDVDSDGDLDILLGDDNGKLMLIRRIGHGDPLAASDFSGRAIAGSFNANSTPMAMAAGDFTNDGHLDVVVSGNNDEYTLFVGDGQGWFTPQVITDAGPNAARGKAAADFNEDGKLDFITLNSTNADVDLFLGDGAGNFEQRSSKNLAKEANSYTCVAGDFDGDQHADFITSDDSTGIYSFYKGSGAGTFAPAIAAGITQVGDTVAAAAYLDAGPTLDLLVSRDGDNTQVFVYTGDGDGTFTAAGSIAMAFAGVNLGLATPTFGSAASSWSVDPASVNAALMSITVENAAAHLFRVTPVNGQSGSDDVTFTLSDGNGGSAQKTDVTITIAPVAYANPLISAGLDGFVTDEDVGFVFDLSRFGSDPDGANGKHFAATSNDTGNVSVVPMNLNGTFGAAIDLGDVGDRIRGLAIADFDNDGDLDLIFADGVQKYPTDNVNDHLSDVFWMERVGHSDTLAADFALPASIGEFTASQPSYFSGFSWVNPTNYGMDLCVEDFNNDGIVDLLVGGNWTVLELFLGNGDGSFAKSTVDAALAGNSRGMDAADFDGDGNMDFVHRVSGNNEMYVYQGDGSGAFTRSELTNAAFDTGGYAVCAGDFDGDHKADIVTVDTDNGRCYFLKGNGDLTFLAGVECGTQAGGYTLIAGNSCPDAADGNGDGILDLFLHYDNGHQTRFYPGVGDGTFTFSNGAPTLSVMSGTDLGFAACDFGSTVLTWTLDAASVNTALLDVQLVNAASGVVQVTPVANMFGSDDISFTLTDANEGTTQKIDVTITVTSVNDAPTLSGLPSIGIDSNSAGRQNVIFLPAFASDVESYGSLTYTIESQTNAALCNVTIDGSNYVDLGATGANTGSNVVTVRASDGNPADDALAGFTVWVTNGLSWLGQWNSRKQLGLSAAAGDYYVDLTISDAATLAKMRADRADVRVLLANLETPYTKITDTPLRLRFNATIDAGGYHPSAYVYYGYAGASAPSYSFTPFVTSLTPRVYSEDGTFIRRWSDAINWSPLLVPTDFTDVTIGTGYAHAPEVDANANCRGLQIDAGTTLDFGPGSLSLSTGGPVTLDGTMTLREGSSLLLGSQSGADLTTHGLTVSATGTLQCQGANFGGGNSEAGTNESLIVHTGVYAGQNHIGKWILMKQGLAKGRFYQVTLNNADSLTRADTSSALDSAATLDPVAKTLSCSLDLVASDGQHVGRYAHDLTGATGYHRIVKSVNGSPDVLFLDGDLTGFVDGDSFEISDGVQPGDEYELMQFAAIASKVDDGNANAYLLFQDGAEVTLWMTDLYKLGANYTNKWGVTAQSISGRAGGESLSINQVRIRNGYRGLVMSGCADFTSSRLEVRGHQSHGIQLLSSSNGINVQDARISANGGDGIRVESGGGNGFVLLESEVLGNQGAGLRLLAGADKAAVWKCALADNEGGGVVISSVNSVTLGSSSVFGHRNGAGVGVDLDAATEITLADCAIGGNLVGIRAASDVTALTIWGGDLGYGQPNDTWQVQLGTLGSAAVVQMRGVGIADTNMIDPSGIDLAGDRVISRNQRTRQGADQGVTYLWGEYPLTGGATETHDRAAPSYAAQATTPRSHRGASSIAAVTISATTKTEHWATAYLGGGQWIVFGSVAGMQGGMAQAGVPYTSDGGEVSFTITEVSPLLDDTIDFATLAPAGDANAQKQIVFGPCAAGYNGGLSKLTVPATSTLVLLGTAAEPTTLKGLGDTQRFLVSIQGAINADGYAVLRPAASGLDLAGNATVTSLANGVFDLPADSGTLLNFGSYTGAPLVIPGCSFENSETAVGASNVKATATTTNIVRFGAFTGSFSGEDFDDDPPEKIRWGDVDPPITAWVADLRFSARDEVLAGRNVGATIYGDLLTDRTAALGFSAKFKTVGAFAATKVEVQVGTAPGLADTWNSGLLPLPDAAPDAQSFDIPYRGSPLAYDTTYYYRLRFTDVYPYTGQWGAEQSFRVERPAVRTTSAGQKRSGAAALKIRGRTVYTELTVVTAAALTIQADLWIKKPAGYVGEATITLRDAAGKIVQQIATDNGSDDAWAQYSLGGAATGAGVYRLEFELPDPASEIYLDDQRVTITE